MVAAAGERLRSVGAALNARLARPGEEKHGGAEEVHLSWGPHDLPSAAPCCLLLDLC